MKDSIVIAALVFFGWFAFSVGQLCQRQLSEDTKLEINRVYDSAYRAGLVAGTKQEQARAEKIKNDKPVGNSKFCSLEDFIMGRREPGL